MSESFKTRLVRWGYNLFPAYRRTGGKIIYIASDFKEIRVKLPLNWKTRNYVGTIFGGSMYGVVDPIYMVMLIQLLGKDYVVWDKAGTIRFIKPGRSTLFGRFTIDDRELATIRSKLESRPNLDRTYSTTLTDATGTVHAEIEKTIYIRCKGSR